VLPHEPRRLRSWLIFDVRQRSNDPMAKDIAVLEAAYGERAISCLEEIGFSFTNPDREISGWSSDRLVFRDRKAALDAFQSGTLLQMWREGWNDLCLSYFPRDEVIRIYFDGWTRDETEAIQAVLNRCGIRFEIEYD
jgi:hypothetical protein